MKANIDDNGTLVVPSGTKKIMRREYAMNEQIKRLVLPEGLEEIGELAFEACKNLVTVEFPASLRKVGPYAFGASGLNRVSFAEGVRIACIGKQAFGGCDIQELDIPGSVDVIGDSAFENGKHHIVKELGPRRVRIRDGVKHIGDRAFMGCALLSVFEVPEPPETIGEGAFDGCSDKLIVPQSKEDAQTEPIVGKYPDGYVVGVAGGEYLVIDISRGPGAEHYPVEYLEKPPEGGWGAEYKKDKIAFRLIRPHGFMMGKPPAHHVELSCPYYMAVFPLTVGQWLNIMGGSIADIREEIFGYQDVDDKDEELCHYTMTGDIDKFRAEIEGKEWPKSMEVLPDCLVGVLRRKTRISNIDLPTEAEWEFACKEGNGGYQRFDECVAGGAERCMGEVGEGAPNGWGLHDIGSGNAWEYCVDKYGKSRNLAAKDPIGGGNYTKGNVMKGGWYYLGCGNSTSSAEERGEDNGGGWERDERGVRLCITLGQL